MGEQLVPLEVGGVFDAAEDDLPALRSPVKVMCSLSVLSSEATRSLDWERRAAARLPSLWEEEGFAGYERAVST